MGIRPFVAIRQDISQSAPNILESQMKGILVGPAVQEENDFSERINVSSAYGTIQEIMTRAATEVVNVEVVGLNTGAKVDFSTLGFGAKTIVAKLDTTGVYEAAIMSDAEKHILKVTLSADDGVDGKITILELLQKGAEVGDSLEISFNNGTDDVVESHKVREFEIVDNAGTDELYISLWSEIADALITDAIVLTIAESKNIAEANISVLAPLVVTGNSVSGTSYTIDNQSNPVDGSFIASLYVYLPLTAPSGPDFSNIIVSTVQVNTLSNYSQTENTYKVSNGSLYNFFSANRVDIANNIFEVTTENYIEMLGNPTVSNKLAYAMKLISAEVPGASMKVYVTEDDSSASYIKALERLATSDTVYSVTALTDESAVANSLVGMVKVASTDTIAKWKMAVMCPRVPHFNKKISTEAYTVTQIASTNSFYVEATNGGFLTVGIKDGDSILGSDKLDIANDTYYDEVGETYSGMSYATVDSVVTDDKLIVTVFEDGLDLSTVLSGQGLVVGTINQFSNIKDDIKANLESIGNHGVVSLFPDKYEATVDSVSVLIPGYYVAAITNAIMAHLPPQQGLSNLSYNSLDKVIGSSFQFTDGELDEIASCGSFVLLQESYSSRPYVLRQLTTDMTSLESMEINKVRCLDYATLGFASVLNNFVGKRNVTDANIEEIRGLLNSAGLAMVRSTENAFLGSIITEFEIVDVFVPSGEKDAISCIIDVETPTSLNKIRLFVSSGKSDDTQS